MRRREWITTLPAAALLSSCSRSLEEEQTATDGMTAVGASEKLEAFGLQLSTLTPLLMADFEGTLAKVAAIGYKQVEFSALGFLGRPVELVEQLLRKYGLSAPVGRISPKMPDGFNELSREEQFKAFAQYSSPDYLLDNVVYALESAKALGQKHLALPALLPAAFTSRSEIESSIDLLRRCGEICAAEGIQFGYHNHDWELKPVDGLVPLNHMLDRVEAELLSVQIDIYWVTKAGGAPLDYLKDFPGRFPTCHLKDITVDGDFEDVGYGEIDMPEFVSSAMASGTKYYFVERDNPPEPIKTAERAYTYLEQMTY